MFTFTVTAEFIGDGIDNRLQQIDSMRESIPLEMVAWQRDDMRRQYPNIEEIGDSWLTLIWPRSRLEVRRRAQGRKRKTVFTRAALGSRPILRPELFDKLHNRMRLLLANATSTTSPTKGP